MTKNALSILVPLADVPIYSTAKNLRLSYNPFHGKPLVKLALSAFIASLYQVYIKLINNPLASNSCDMQLVILSLERFNKSSIKLLDMAGDVTDGDVCDVTDV